MRENKPGSGESHRSLGALELIHETSIPFAKDDKSVLLCPFYRREN